MSSMPAARNLPDDIKIRKYRDTLITGGLALIAFGVWTVISSVLKISNGLEDLVKTMTFAGLTEEQIEKLGETVLDKSMLFGIVGIVVVLAVVDLVFRIYVGMSARAVGLQKKKKNGKKKNGILWIILGFILFAVGLYSLVSTLLEANLIIQIYSVPGFVIELFVDATSVFITAEMVITGLRLRSLSKKQNITEEVRDAA